jgi:hypothetical protein
VSTATRIIPSRASVSRQRRRPLRKQPRGRCVLCGKPATGRSRALCSRHLASTQLQWCGKQSNGRYPGAPGSQCGSNPSVGNDPRHRRTALPIRFAYQARDIEIAAFICRHQTSPELVALLQTFLTSLSWMCSMNGSPTDGWLTLTTADSQSLWKVTRGVGDKLALQLVSGARAAPVIARRAVKRLGALA